MAYVQVEGLIWPEGITEAQKRIVDLRNYYKPMFIQGKLCALHQNYPKEFLVVGINTDGTFEREYLYENNPDAVNALDTYTDLNEHPSGPWRYCVGTFRGEEIDIEQEKK